MKLVWTRMRYLLVVVLPCLLFGLEYSLAFVAGVTASTLSVLGSGEDNHTTTATAAAATTTATTVAPPAGPSSGASTAKILSSSSGGGASSEDDDTNHINKKHTTNGKPQQHHQEITKQWDTTSATHAAGTGTASFFSTIFSSSSRNHHNNNNSNNNKENAANDDGTSSEKKEKEDDRNQQRLIEWNTNNLLDFLEKLMSSRSTSAQSPDQVVIAQQMKQFVTRISSLYESKNPYHNFEHATHVGKSLRQVLLSNPDGKVLEDDGSNPMKTIQEDPLVTFSLGFAAMIHDVQHQGIPNTRLAVENPTLASKYDNSSIAERNSIDISLNLLLEDASFEELKNAIISTGGRRRFEYFVTRAVLATDIADSSLRADRQQRWDAVFNNNNNEGGGSGGVDDDGDSTTTAKEEEELTLVFEEEEDNDNIKYTYTPRTIIAMEHLMQVVDVAHTFQSSHINHVWNERLFAELKSAFKANRVTPPQNIDPLEGWYQNEINFFDYYVIPLAKKWELCCGCIGCGFFGTTTDPEEQQQRRQQEEEGEELSSLLFPTEISFLEQARRNRQEWETIGHGVVEEFKEKY